MRKMENNYEKDKEISKLKHQLNIVENAYKSVCSTITCDECPFSDSYAYCKLVDEGIEMSEEVCISEIGNFYKNKVENNLGENRNDQTRN